MNPHSEELKEFLSRVKRGRGLNWLSRETGVSEQALHQYTLADPTALTDTQMGILLSFDLELLHLNPSMP